MAFIFFNENPKGKRTGDCSVRAISVALSKSWDEAHDLLCQRSAELGDMPSENSVIGSVLRSEGFYRRGVSNWCPDCYTVADFASEHPKGIYVLFTGGHVVTIRDGNWYDSWDSGAETPQYYWMKED